MRTFLKLFIVLLIISCSSNDNTFNYPNIYKGVIDKTKFEANDIPVRIDDNELSLTNLEFYLRIDKEGLLDIVIKEISSNSTFILKGKLKEFPNTDYKSLEIRDLNNPDVLLFLDLNTDENGRLVVSSMENDIAFYIKKSKTTTDEVFNKMIQNASNKESFLPFQMGQNNYSENISDFWLGYFDLEDILIDRMQKMNEERDRLTKLNDDEILRKRENDVKEKRKLDLCESLINYDINNFTKYGVNEDCIARIKKMRTGERNSSTLCNISGKPYMPKNKYSIGYMDEENILFVKLDGKNTSYIGPFTKLYDGTIYAGAQGIHGKLFILTTEKNNELISEYRVLGCQ